jgi:hypothetical protein
MANFMMKSLHLQSNLHRKRYAFATTTIAWRMIFSPTL